MVFSFGAIGSKNTESFDKVNRASHRIVMADGVVSWENMVINLDLEEFLFICEEGFVW